MGEICPDHQLGRRQKNFQLQVKTTTQKILERNDAAIKEKKIIWRELTHITQIT